MIVGVTAASGRSASVNGTGRHTSRSTRGVGAADLALAEAGSGAVRPGARCSAGAEGGLCRLVARACAVLGGTIMATGLAWAIAAGSASAAEQAEEPRSPVSGAVTEVIEAGRALVTETVGRATQRVPGARRAVEAMRTTEPMLVAEPARQGGPAATPRQQGTRDNVRPTATVDQLPDRAQHQRADINGGDEVAATGEDSDFPGASRAESLRTTSGTDGRAASRADDAPSAHDPASAPSPVCPVATASGCSAGSSLMPAFVGHIPDGSVPCGSQPRVVAVPPCGRPDTTGAQPGTSPD